MNSEIADFLYMFLAGQVMFWIGWYRGRKFERKFPKTENTL